MSGVRSRVGFLPTRRSNWATLCSAITLTAVPHCIRFSIEQIPLVLAVLLVRFAFDFLPVDELDRRRNHARQRRTLDGFEAFAAARDSLVAAGEFERLAAGGFDLEHLALLRDDRA